MGDRTTPGRAAARPVGTAGALLLLALLAGCATQTLQPPTTQRGVASWYGPGFHGQATASGETYDQFEMTAAHRTWPLGTRVRVTNEQNGRSCTVRINDRGPQVRDRIIDLSKAAAAAIDMVQAGEAPVVLLEP